MKSAALFPALALSLTATFILGGCTTSGDNREQAVRPAAAPLSGVVDGTDHSDHDCLVVLRAASRTQDGPGFETDCSTGACYFVWRVTVDVADEVLEEGGQLGVLYHSGSGDQWWEAEAEMTLEGAPEGYQRFLLRVFDHTVGPGMSMTSLMRTQISMIPVVHLPGGGRIFDHNRNSGDFDNYELVEANEWSISDDESVCSAAPAPVGTVEFRAGWTEVQHGAIVAGGQLRLWYDPARLPNCRASYTFAPAWDIEAQGRFLPSGETFSGSIVAFEYDDYGRRIDSPHPGTLEIEVPQDATSVEVWFRNWSGMSHPCEEYDSQFGENYHIEIIRPQDRPNPVHWAGDWGNGLWRGCEHRSGLEEPTSLDSYLMQRACLDVYADVYVPGLTDGTHERPELLLAQVEHSLDETAPQTSWLSYIGRVGNNYRYRWTLPREELNRTEWSELRYAFRFSTDGINWHRIAQNEGPGGGPARTMIRAF